MPVDISNKGAGDIGRQRPLIIDEANFDISIVCPDCETLSGLNGEAEIGRVSK